MPKVFIVHENPRFDYAPAEMYGEVVFMTEVEFSGISNSLTDQHVIHDVKNAVARFDPMEDFLVLTGSPIIMGFVMHLVLQLNRPVKLLRHDNRANSYRPVVFTHHIN